MDILSKVISKVKSTFKFKLFFSFKTTIFIMKLYPLWKNSLQKNCNHCTRNNHNYYLFLSLCFKTFVFVYACIWKKKKENGTEKKRVGKREREIQIVGFV